MKIFEWPFLGNERFLWVFTLNKSFGARANFLTSLTNSHKSSVTSRLLSFPIPIIVAHRAPYSLPVVPASHILYYNICVLTSLIFHSHYFLDHKEIYKLRMWPGSCQSSGTWRQTRRQTQTRHANHPWNNLNATRKWERWRRGGRGGKREGGNSRGCLHAGQGGEIPALPRPVHICLQNSLCPG